MRLRQHKCCSTSKPEKQLPITMITLSHINTKSTRVFMGTLTNGENIHEAFVKIADAENIHAATFEMLGGLT